MRHMERSLRAIKNEFLLPASLAPIAQLVEQLPLKEMVLGSNPSGRTKTRNLPCGRFFALCEAQRCFAIAKPRAGVASDFADEQTRLVPTKRFFLPRIATR
jgi:hypothetical protein